jgi:hypothetical protein
MAGATAAGAEVAPWGALEGELVATEVGEVPVGSAIQEVGGEVAEADIAQVAVAETEITNDRVPDTGASAGGKNEEEETFRRTFGARLIRPNRLTFPLKLLVWLAVTQIVLVAILMTLQKVRQPQVNRRCRTRRVALSRYRWRCSSS